MIEEKPKRRNRKKLPRNSIDKMIHQYHNSNMNIDEICYEWGISHPTLYRYIAEFDDSR
ncbi:helix-turn-helix domain-containing protein [Vibrio rarus]